MLNPESSNHTKRNLAIRVAALGTVIGVGAAGVGLSLDNQHPSGQPSLEPASQPSAAGRSIKRPSNDSSEVQADDFGKSYTITNPLTGETVTVDNLSDGYQPELHNIRQTAKSLTDEAPSNELLKQSIANAGIDINQPYVREL